MNETKTVSSTEQGNERVRRLIGYLQRLADPENPDRAALAALRSGLRRTPGDDYPTTFARMVPYVVPHLGETRQRDEHWFYIVAALFALHQGHTDQKGKDGKAKTLGASFREMRDDSDSITARFTALLNSRSDNLPEHLRHAVSLMKARDVSINFYRLLDDCLRWDLPGRPVQIKWARDFYAE